MPVVWNGIPVGGTSGNDWTYNNGDFTTHYGTTQNVSLAPLPPPPTQRIFSSDPNDKDFQRRLAEDMRQQQIDYNYDMNRITNLNNSIIAEAKYRDNLSAARENGTVPYLPSDFRETDYYKENRAKDVDIRNTYANEQAAYQRQLQQEADARAAQQLAQQVMQKYASQLIFNTRTPDQILADQQRQQQVYANDPAYVKAYSQGLPGLDLDSLTKYGHYSGITDENGKPILNGIGSTGFDPVAGKRTITDADVAARKQFLSDYDAYKQGNNPAFAALVDSGVFSPSASGAGPSSFNQTGVVYGQDANGQTVQRSLNTPMASLSNMDDWQKQYLSATTPEARRQALLGAYQNTLGQTTANLPSFSQPQPTQTYSSGAPVPSGQAPTYLNTTNATNPGTAAQQTLQATQTYSQPSNAPSNYVGVPNTPSNGAGSLPNSAQVQKVGSEYVASESTKKKAA